jgi:hypothetical protein
MITEFSTIHIFAYGEAQIISNDVNFKASVTEFTKLNPVIADVKAQRPADVLEGDYHAINIFYSADVRYMGKEQQTSFSCPLASLNEAKLNALIAEFASLEAASTPSV